MGVGYLRRWPKAWSFVKERRYIYVYVRTVYISREFYGMWGAVGRLILGLLWQGRSPVSELDARVGRAEGAVAFLRALRVFGGKFLVGLAV